MAITAIQEEYIAWLLMSKRDKRLHNLPETKGEWAEWKGLSPRTPRRWQTSPVFQQLYEQRKLGVARRNMPGSTVAAQTGGAQPSRSPAKHETVAPVAPEDDPTHDGQADPAEQQYLRLRDQLAADALNGKQDAMNLWFKYYGAAFVEQDRQSDGSIADMSNEALARELVGLLGLEEVARVMASV